MAAEFAERPKPKPKATASTIPNYIYGRTQTEIERDAKLLAEKFYTDHELKTITVLSVIKRFGKEFVLCSHSEQIKIVDDIAYPENAQRAFSQGVAFFTLIRNLTASGFYSSQMGHNDMDYQGNRPNSWEGVPEDVLKTVWVEL